MHSHVVIKQRNNLLMDKTKTGRGELVY